MDGRVRGILGNHLPGELGVVVMRVTDVMGFKPCPICGKYGWMDLMTKESFDRIRTNTQGYTGIVRVSCERCKLDMYEMDYEVAVVKRDYEDMLDALRRKWNKRTNESL